VGLHFSPIVLNSIQKNIKQMIKKKNLINALTLEEKGNTILVDILSQ